MKEKQILTKAQGQKLYKEIQKHGVEIAAVCKLMKMSGPLLRWRIKNARLTACDLKALALALHRISDDLKHMAQLIDIAD